jgi:hypothetical protein
MTDPQPTPINLDHAREAVRLVAQYRSPATGIRTSTQWDLLCDHAFEHYGDIAAALIVAVGERDRLVEQWRLRDLSHCNDCCCARTWEALGVSVTDGRDIAEHVTALRAALIAAHELAEVSPTPKEETP